MHLCYQIACFLILVDAQASVSTGKSSSDRTEVSAGLLVAAILLSGQSLVSSCVVFALLLWRKLGLLLRNRERSAEVGKLFSHLATRIRHQADKTSWACPCLSCCASQAISSASKNAAKTAVQTLATARNISSLLSWVIHTLRKQGHVISYVSSSEICYIAQSR